jgi:hypothetical protein
MPSPRYLRFLFCLALLPNGPLLVAPARAQEPSLQMKVRKVQVGFRGYSEDAYLFKQGLWAPVYVELEQSADGSFSLPVGADNYAHGRATIRVNDGDGVLGTYLKDFDLRKSDGSVVVVGYANPGPSMPQVQLNLTAGSSRYAMTTGEMYNNLGLGQHLYLTLGNRMPDLHKALVDMAPKSDEQSSAPRFAGYETQLERLPTEWFGYQAVDLLILTSDNKEFIKGLAGQQYAAARAALAGWVRRGGRLVVSVSWENQQEVYRLLHPGAKDVNTWQPALPLVLTQDEQVRLSSMKSVNNWAGYAGQNYLATPQDPVNAARLKPGKEAEVLLQEETGEPLIVRVPYGRGSVTLLAFALDKAPFLAWQGRTDFWKKLILTLAPRVANGNENNPNMRPRGGMGQEYYFNDLATQMNQELDQFSVPQISFGWVALFILIFIVIVGPLDFVLLFYVFKRPEWTWITFPVVVLGVTVISYFTAYTLKGSELKINQVDLVDVDLRTSLDKDYKTSSAYAYGTTWFAILSPRIEDYTIGVEPALAAWAKNPNAVQPMNKVMVTWVGRPDSDVPGGLGRSRPASLFRRIYEYAPDATGLKQVPIPVWTTRAFTSTWEVKCEEMPFEADFSYRVLDPDEKVTGTLRNNLPLALEDCALIYNKRFYTLDALPARGARPVQVKLADARSFGLDHWAKDFVPQRRFAPYYNEQRSSEFEPGPILKRMYFHDYTVGTSIREGNHMYRPLDQSWRVQEVPPGTTGVRTAILVGKLARSDNEADRRPASHLWLGELPLSGKAPPTLPGTLTQETYIRVLIPVRPE